MRQGDVDGVLNNVTAFRRWWSWIRWRSFQIKDARVINETKARLPIDLVDVVGTPLQIITRRLVAASVQDHSDASNRPQRLNDSRLDGMVGRAETPRYIGNTRTVQHDLSANAKAICEGT